MQNESEQNTKLILELQLNDKIEYIVTTTNSTGIINLNKESQSLNKGTIYKFKLQNKELNLDDFHVIKIETNFREKIEILNVKNGIISLMPRIQGTIVQNNDILGYLL